MANEMNEDRLKEFAKWARQAAEDGQGNIRKLGESLLEVIAEVRRLRTRTWELQGAIVMSNQGFSAPIDSSSAPRHKLRFNQDPHLSTTEETRIRELVESRIGKSLRTLGRAQNQITGHVELVFEENEDT
jgi:hypothetical protein